jgi:predicted RNA binding protein YcfA (HicA-like mRNA interferase family)
VRRKGSHVIVRCGDCMTTVLVHKGKDIPTGTLAAIVRQLADCIGREWTK